MERSQRRRYLEALGLEPWSLRTSTPSAVEPVPATAPVREATAPLAAPASRALGVAEATPVLAAHDWEGLRTAVSACRKCRLCETRTQTVFGVGPHTAPLMVVGEAPGADEDAQGEPFVGRAGKLLDEMLRAIGRSRKADTYIANVVKCRPPGNREPEPDEAESCRAFLEQQLKLVKPKLIVALGRVAAQRLLVTDTPIGKMRGQIYQWGPDATPLMVTYHPAYLLRNPVEKAKSWEDLKRIHRFIQSVGGVHEKDFRSPPLVQGTS